MNELNKQQDELITKLSLINRIKKIDIKQKIMRAANKTVYIQPNYSNTYNQFQPFQPQFNQPYILSKSRALTQRLCQKTEQPITKYISQNALKFINQQLYQIINMDPSYAQSNLRKSAKKVYELVDNQLLFNIKHLSNMKLLLYNVILMYVDQFSQHQKQRNQSILEKQKQKSVSSSKNISTLKQQDISLQSTYNQFNNNKQLQNLKQTVPFIPKDKNKLNKNTRIQMIEEQLSSKIQSTKQSLQSILNKIEHYNNYQLSGEDIMRLKKSVINVSELKPSHFLNLHTLSPTQPPKQMNLMDSSRPQSRQEKSNLQNTQMSRSGSRNKTFSCFKDQNNSTSLNSRVQETCSDEEGNKLLIQQLEQIIQRKENRIKQLNKELVKNLSDQKQLERTIQNFQFQINQIDSQRKNFQQIIQKLQEQNLNYQLQIKQLKDAAILRKQADKLSHIHQQDSSQYNVLKQFQKHQKIFKLNIRKQVQVIIENTINLQNQSREKDLNSLSGGSPFNDISQITPKRLNKKLILPNDIDQSYILQSNVITTRKNISPQIIQTDRSNNKSVSKYQMIEANRTKSKSKKQHDSYINSRQEMKDNERSNYEKILFLQALTIQQMLQDL